MTIDDKQTLDRWLGAWLLVALRPVSKLLGKLLRRDHRITATGEVVFIKLLGGGSLLIALPALLGVRRRFPGRALTLVCGRGVAPFAELLGVFDRIDVIEDDRGLVRLLASAGAVLAGLLRRRVDTVVDFEVYSQLTTVFSLLTCARNRIGFYVDSAYWRRNALTHLVFFNRARGTFHFYAATAHLLGAGLPSRAEIRSHLLARVGGARAPEPILAVGAGCSEFASVRHLPLAEWREFAERRRGELAGLRWVFLGAAADRELSDEIAASLREVLGAEFRCENRCGELALRDSLALLAGARRFVGIDSALIHAARALAVPSTSFFGPTDPVTLLEPIEGYEEEVHYRPPICSPCLHVAQTPPCKGDNVCMRLFTSSEVASAPWCEDASGASILPLELE
jgi:ADP-heptose:LPS heptosyltransferase